MKDMTQVEWTELKTALESVPVKRRNEPWKKAVDFVNAVLSGKDRSALELDFANPDKFRYTSSCSLCRRPIKLDEDYVFKFPATVNHLDCWYQERDDEKT